MTKENVHKNALNGKEVSLHAMAPTYHPSAILRQSGTLLLPPMRRLLSPATPGLCLVQLTLHTKWNKDALIYVKVLTLCKNGMSPHASNTGIVQLTLRADHHRDLAAHRFVPVGHGTRMCDISVTIRACHVLSLKLSLTNVHNFTPL